MAKNVAERQLLRDPDYIRQQLIGLELLSRLYFRARVTGLDNIPLGDPVIFVGNHSGGVTTPDSILFAQAFWSEFGTEREIYALVQRQALNLPVFSTHLKKLGCVAATAATARRLLDRGASVLIYPGAGHEAYRPFWRSHQIDLNDQSAYVRLAIQFNAPIVPIVSLGGHETFIALSDGDGIARTLGLKQFGLERLPLSLALPWGISLGLSHHIPWPSRIDIRCGAPISFRGFSRTDLRDRCVVADCHNHVEASMQSILDHLVEERSRQGQTCAVSAA